MSSGPAMSIRPYDTRPFTCAADSKASDFLVGDTALNLILSEICLVNRIKSETTAELFLAEQMLPPDWDNLYQNFTEESKFTMRLTVRAYLLGSGIRNRAQDTRPRLENITERYSAAQLIFIPINTGGHWTLGVIDSRMQSILFFNTQRTSGNIGRIERILRFLGESLKTADITGYVFLDVSPLLPQQSDGWTCGYHVIRYAEMMVQSVANTPPNVLTTHDASISECFEYREYLSQMLLRIEEKARGSKGAPIVVG